MTRPCVQLAASLGAVLLFALPGCDSVVVRPNAEYLATLPTEVVGDVRRLPVYKTLAPGRGSEFALDRPFPMLAEGDERSYAILLALPPLTAEHEVAIRSRFRLEFASDQMQAWHVAYPRVRLLDADFAMLREIAPGRFVGQYRSGEHFPLSAIVASIYIPVGDGRARYLLLTAATGVRADSRMIRGTHGLPAGTIRIAPTGVVDVLLRSLAGDVVTTY